MRVPHCFFVSITIHRAGALWKTRQNRIIRIYLQSIFRSRLEFRIIEIPIKPVKSEY